MKASNLRSSKGGASFSLNKYKLNIQIIRVLCKLLECINVRYQSAISYSCDCIYPGVSALTGNDVERIKSLAVLASDCHITGGGGRVDLSGGDLGARRGRYRAPGGKQRPRQLSCRSRLARCAAWHTGVVGTAAIQVAILAIGLII